METSGHLFIINGDVSKIACDAWLLPTDRNLSTTKSFIGALNASQNLEIEALVRQNRTSSVWVEDGQERSCIRLAIGTEALEPTLWLGDVGRSRETDLAHFADRAREFVRCAAEDVRSRRPDLGRRPLVALNVIGSGHGGKRRERGPLLRTLIGQLVDCCQEFATDVILVTWGNVMYSAAQKARRELSVASKVVWRSLPEQLRLEAEALGERARNGDLVVFLGAGVSRSAGIPLWRDLLEVAARKMSLSEDDIRSLSHLDLRDQATVISSRDEVKFLSILQESLASVRYSLLHGLISSLPVREFVTTNFDQLFELSARSAGRDMKVITQDKIVPGDRWILKLHGDLGRDLVITRGGYMGALHYQAPLRGLVQSLLIQKHMLFVGYSLSDEDFHHLMHDLRSTISKDQLKNLGTVLMLRRSSAIESIWSELKFIHADDDDPTSVTSTEEDQAHRLAVFLDYIGCHSASDVQFVLDDSMGDLISEEEEELAHLLNGIDALVKAHRSDSGKWSEIQKFLGQFRIQEDL